MKQNATIRKRRVLVMGTNFSPELTGIGKYTGEMVEWLTGCDYDCTVVTTFPYYPQWKIQSPYSGRWYKKEKHKDSCLTVYRCPMYVPASPSGLKRIVADATFCFTSFLALLLLLFKPRHDYIFCMAPPFLLGYLAVFYRFFKGGKMIYHIHDLQIEAARDLGIIKAGYTFKILFALERFILQSTDVLTTVSVGMRKKIMKKTTKEVIHFPNWVNIDSFWPIEKDVAYRKSLGFDEHDKIVLYSGSLGEKQGLDTLISIAKNLEDKPDIKFVICGTGPYKDKLVKMAELKNLKNFFFLPLQELCVFNQFLNMANVHLVIQKTNACDLMMPSKLTNILAVGGLALVTANPGTNLYELINDRQMGVLVPSEDENALKEGIIKCCNQDYATSKINGRRYVERNLDRHEILHQLMRKIDGQHSEIHSTIIQPQGAMVNN